MKKRTTKQERKAWVNGIDSFELNWCKMQGTLSAGPMRGRLHQVESRRLLNCSISSKVLSLWHAQDGTLPLSFRQFKHMWFELCFPQVIPQTAQPIFPTLKMIRFKAKYIKISKFLSLHLWGFIMFQAFKSLSGVRNFQLCFGALQLVVRLYFRPGELLVAMVASNGRWFGGTFGFTSVMQIQHPFAWIGHKDD